LVVPPYSQYCRRLSEGVVGLGDGRGVVGRRTYFRREGADTTVDDVLRWASVGCRGGVGHVVGETIVEWVEMSSVISGFKKGGGPG